ncbi:DUF4405 domain-containing protein [Priestia megaterium]|uniref:DUF4405 domain-containing protein n=1 Tax=Priestia megaterium TaxID=1404 RepID=UPI00215D51D3|nr:DUF4405 domain-containing protein [Priestia megaterium]MED4215486.1 DUF4405 domain-containing protein [Priestia megaterium]WEZ39844.1 DUF4405 domain-containing protein [Priestia megaterium DSM 319]
MNRVKKMMYVRFGLDLLMAVTFVLFFNKQVLGGLTFHEIAGLAIAVAFFTHVLLNWQWVKKVTVKLFDRKLPRRTKFGYFLNIMLLITMSFIMVSGIFISRVVFPNINVGNEQWFKISHISVSFLVLILVAAHIGLHWQWVINVCKNMTKFKKLKKSLSIAAKLGTVALLVVGIYEINETGFLGKLGGIAKVLNLNSSDIPQNGGGKLDFDHHSFSENKSSATASAGHERPNFDHDGRGMERGMKGKESGFESPNPFIVIGTYFAIMSVFISVIYYIGKILSEVKRRKKMAGPTAEI